MEKGPAKRSSLFLLELIVAILFFALASAVCVQIYVGARVKSRDSADLSRAVLVCQNGAESLYAAIGTQADPLRFLAQSQTDYHQEPTGIALYFAKDWHPATPKDAVFSLHLSLSSTTTTGLQTGTAQVLRQGEAAPLCSLPVSKYIS